MRTRLNLETTDQVIGATMRVMRQNVGLTQEELAQALHTTQAVVSGIESGKRSIRLWEAVKCSKVVGLSPVRLVHTVRDVLASRHLLDT